MLITSHEDLIFGHAPRPLTTSSGLIIGGGTVYPEINFTLPPIQITEPNWAKILQQYRQMMRGVCERSVELKVPGLVVEFETLPDMTRNPVWAVDITGILVEELAAFNKSEGLKSVLRLTPNDLREQERPPRMRTSRYLEKMFETFSGGMEAGAEWVAIESTGGKEVFDNALLMGDLLTIVFALGVLACRDMEFLWSRIVSLARENGAVPSGDSACGFANTAMVLSDKRMVPRVLAAVVRVASVPRSLIAFEQGAVGPSKDCAFEGPYLKAIAGVPISMEGKSAACALLSSLGNISQSACDLWSNESVQNVRLLSTDAPVVSLEQLAYDCRLLNAATAAGPEQARQLRDLLVQSDAGLDPQAYVLRPDVVVGLASKIMEHSTPYQRTVRAVRETLDVLAAAVESGELELPPPEIRWLEKLRRQADLLPDAEASFLSQCVDWKGLRGQFKAEEYGLVEP